MSVIVNRRRVMGAVKEQGYIQDGLVFWLDGIDKGSNEGYWTDLVGGCQYQFVTGAESVANGVELTSHVYMPLVSGNAPDGDDKTIEVVFVKKDGSDSVAQIFSIDNEAPAGSIGVFIVNNKNVFMQRRNCILENPTQDVLSRYSYNIDICCVNGNQGTFTTSDYWRPVEGIGGSSSRSIIGTIHSIRIYDRKLLLAEMIQNQKFDLVRFGQ